MFTLHLHLSSTTSPLGWESSVLSSVLILSRSRWDSPPRPPSSAGASRCLSSCWTFCLGSTFWSTRPTVRRSHAVFWRPMSRAGMFCSTVQLLVWPGVYNRNRFSPSPIRKNIIRITYWECWKFSPGSPLSAQPFICGDTNLIWFLP